MAKQPARTQIKFRPATASRWPDVEKLFGERGACGGCWCMFWRCDSRKEFDANKGTGNKRAFQKIVASGGRPGVLAYRGNEPIGWCAVAPRSQYVALERSRVLKPVDDQPVWSISCLFVRKQDRRQGIATDLIRAAVEFAASKGAAVVEGYPVEPSMEKMPDPFIWNGVPTNFVAAGFTEVLRRSASRPIMRFTISR